LIGCRGDPAADRGLAALKDYFDAEQFENLPLIVAGRFSTFRRKANTVPRA
jgi:hypothetical protein